MEKMGLLKDILCPSILNRYGLITALGTIEICTLLIFYLQKCAGEKNFKEVEVCLLNRGEGAPPTSHVCDLVHITESAGSLGMTNISPFDKL